tara:strand:+ start:77 stop:403 length:327 start_codon:yes stop_codon:yes gene_type:complete
MNYKSLKKNILLYGLIIIILLSLVFGNKKLYEGNTNCTTEVIDNCSLLSATASNQNTANATHSNCAINNQQKQQNDPLFNYCPTLKDDNTWQHMQCCVTNDSGEAIYT